MDRRAFLALCVVALGSAGCTTGAPEPQPTRPPAEDSDSDPDAAIRNEVADSEAALIAAHSRAIAAHPELTALLAPLVVHHQEHLARVVPGASQGPAAPGSASPDGATPGPAPSSSGDVATPATTPSSAESPGASDRPSPTADQDDSSPTAALEALARAEKSAQHQRASACDGADDAELVRDLCLIAASEAQHAEWLDRAARRDSGR